MLRTIGFIERTRVATRPDVYIECGQVMTLHNDHAVMLRDVHPAAFVDITPKAMFEEYGLEVPHRHALFFTAPCPDCQGAAIRVTACPNCSDTRRMVYL